MVYVDNDPIVLAHARALLTSDPAGSCDYIEADLRDTGDTLARAARTLDFSEPVALMLLGILHMVPDQADPYAIVAALMETMPAGSFLAISHPASDIAAAEGAEAARRYNAQAADPATFRSHAEVAALFDGLDLVEPGVCACRNGGRARRSRPKARRTCGARWRANRDTRPLAGPPRTGGRHRPASRSCRRQRSARATSSRPSPSSRRSAAGGLVRSR